MRDQVLIGEGVVGIKLHMPTIKCHQPPFLHNLHAIQAQSPTRLPTRRPVDGRIAGLEHNLAARCQMVPHRRDRARHRRLIEQGLKRIAGHDDQIEPCRTAKLLGSRLHPVNACAIGLAARQIQHRCRRVDARHGMTAARIGIAQQSRAAAQIENTLGRRASAVEIEVAVR